MRLVIRCLLFTAVVATPLHAQRETVLKQIKVPHNYYYREMYLPQVTTGPSAAAWSPDGSSLVYSMAGSLWRQRIDDSVATQLTDGPGYDYQPDWSPDGASVVYASYRGDAVQLRLLNLQTMADSALVSNGAVNVEPRWSPDGKRIAFVSTAYEGRWHIFTLETSGDKKPARITEDIDSKLPRYYYSKYDHYLSPSWSPDSKEILLVSNRGKIWGSGGMWRMEAKSGAKMTSVHDEETTWQMRPDWAPDGKRVIYSSYLGRQWHQLWLTRSDTDDPFQLTYGDFDITHARWSPDGTRVAYISNGGGNTSLWVTTIPGTARQQVLPKAKKYKSPVGRISIRILDPVSARTMPSRVSVTLADGRSVAPDGAWFHADDGFDRSERQFEVGYFHSNGQSSVTVPAGEVSIEISHGPMYKVHREKIMVAAGQTALRIVRMQRLMALPGWTSGDLHVHMNYGGHYRATPQTLALQARAEGLNLVENLIVNKEDRFPDISYFQPGFGSDAVSTADLMLVHDQEYHTSWWGHVGVLGLSDHLLMPGYSGYAGTAAASLVPDNSQINDLARAQGGLTGYVHPFDAIPDPDDKSTALTTGLPIDVALGKTDYFEVVGFSDHLSTSAVWYRLLNSGFRLPAGAGTDAMTNFASLRGPVGTTRVFVQSGTPMSRKAWYAALKAGKSFATNGPLVQLAINQTGIGGELRLPKGKHTVRAKVTLRSIVPIDHLELIRNGQVAVSIPLGGDRTAIDTTVSVPVTESGWFVLRAYSDKAIEPVLDLYPFGTTSPIYVTVDKQPVRSAEDAKYFLKWIDRIEDDAKKHEGWNTEAEKQGVLNRIAQARREFQSRL